MRVEINSLLVSSPEIHHGRPRIAGTGLTVHRIAVWYRLGHSPEEIARRYGHLTIAQVYAALAYYHANQAEIEAELAADEAQADRLEAEHTAQLQAAPDLSEEEMALAAEDLFLAIDREEEAALAG
jgi:uncharacterized protein (DUF433 family)